MAIRRAEVVIRTTRPLLFHKRPASLFSPDKVAVQKGKAGNSPDEWKDTHTASEDGELFIKQDAVFTCIRDAGRFSKKGRAQMTGYLASAVTVEEEIIATGRKMPKGGETPEVNAYDKPVYLDVRAVKNPNARGSTNIRYRVACSPGVTLKFHLAFEDTAVEHGQLEQALNDAGLLVGIGDGRAIGMGRFVLVSYKPLKAAA